MQTTSLSTRVLDKLGDVASTLLVGMGTVTFIWMLAYFVVAVIQ